jgi:hypothetical protein
LGGSWEPGGGMYGAERGRAPWANTRFLDLGRGLRRVTGVNECNR